MKTRTSCFSALLWLSLSAGCGGDADIQNCQPEGSCTCTDGTERATLCTCAGGSNCSIDGDNIEFQCDGNASCGLACGEDCLVTCPGTTTCTVEVGDNGVINCPGTAICNITCLGTCTVDVAGAAGAVVDCVNEDQGAVCEVTGCSPVDCGGGIVACGEACP